MIQKPKGNHVIVDWEECVYKVIKCLLKTPTKAMTPVAIPYITIPAKINIDGTVIDAKLRGAVIYGEILVDAEQVLNLTGKLK